MGFGPATGLTLKAALCHIRALVGCMIHNQNVFPFKKGNFDGVEGIFGLAGRVLASAL